MTTKQKAGLKIAFGLSRCASALLLATGHGIFAIVLKTRATQLPVARIMAKSGRETLEEGLAEWKMASH